MMIRIYAFRYVVYLGLLTILLAYLLAIFKSGFLSIHNEDKTHPFVRK